MGNSQEKEDIGSKKEEPNATDTRLEVSFQKVYQHHASTSLGLDKNQFKDLFRDCPTLADKVFYDCVKFLLKTSEAEDSCYIQQEDFLSYARTITQIRDRSESLEWIFGMFFKRSDGLQHDEIILLLNTCYRISLRMSLLRDDDDDMIQPVIQSMARSLVGTQSAVDQSDFLRWLTRTCPRLLDCFHDYVCATLSRLPPSSDDKTGGGLAADAEGAPAPVTTDSTSLPAPLMWVLQAYIPMCYTNPSVPGPSLCVLRGEGGWSLLYDSNCQGLSVNRFKHHVMSYAAPTVCFVYFSDHLYCLGCDREWSNRATRWGGFDCFLLQILPKLQLIQAGTDMLYFNTEDRTAPKGLKVGKDPRTTVLQIDEEFSTVKHYGIQLDLDRIQVWGCGSPAELEAQQKQVHWEMKQAQRSKDRKLKLEDWADSPDRQILEFGGVKTSHAER